MMKSLVGLVSIVTFCLSTVSSIAGCKVDLDKKDWRKAGGTSPRFTCKTDTCIKKSTVTMQVYKKGKLAGAGASAGLKRSGKNVSSPISGSIGRQFSKKSNGKYIVTEGYFKSSGISRVILLKSIAEKASVAKANLNDAKRSLSCR